MRLKVDFQTTNGNWLQNPQQQIQLVFQQNNNCTLNDETLFCNYKTTILNINEWVKDDGDNDCDQANYDDSCNINQLTTINNPP